ncbi:23S rRNA (adenine(2030)-N(6))-methyltransferase RlmJ [Parahaliea mediterranea]|uniref:23S rRNA (adenine(2030)-N(6))-methyltransferase RlmJ n=1 Tax=Parahaliea mediterranea TaxID=651086 RepID=UPI0019D448AA|nr:23S rRNA (adenine(2030)-N(6))-methyltransferase RlmJ [Parahaliea mediterranea]
MSVLLSYQHGFHAGNFADVLKHLVLCGTLDYMTRKPAPLLYVDSHAGAGCYRLDDERARKTAEARGGVLGLDWPALLAATPAPGRSLIGCYQKAVSPLLAQRQYPGSPLIARQLLREQDRLALFELHPQEHAALREAMGRDRRIRVQQEDGFRCQGLLPGVYKRALVLIDPPYEVKDDYDRAAELVIRLHRRMRGAVILLWYPVVSRERVRAMVQQLVAAGLADLWQSELGLQADNDGYGMTASGLLMLNPPWQLPEQLQQALPRVQEQLAPAYGFHRVESLTAGPG